MDRRNFLALGGAVTTVASAHEIGFPHEHFPSGAAVPTGKQLLRKIPSSGEMLPAIGLGTSGPFEAGAEPAVREPLREVLKGFFMAGASLIDTSPMYSTAEGVLGDLLTPDQQAKAFIATKVWTPGSGGHGEQKGVEQMQRSMALLKHKRIELMQVHNLVDWRTQLATLREWKAAGRISYLGVTHYTASAYPQLESVLRSEKPDFVQLNYAIDDREAAQRLLPLAADLGIAVLVNRPFGGGGLLRRLRDKPLPGWAAEAGATSWAQLLLRFVLANPAVTCAIPGTSRPEHMADNLAAGRAPLPDAAFWTPARLASVTG